MSYKVRLMTSLAAKVVVITGASSGIGLAAAERCAAAGASVVMLARGVERLRHEADRIEGMAVQCDVADAASVRAAFASIESQFGRVDALLNVAGVSRIRSIAEASDDDIGYVIGVNLVGPIYTSRAAIPLLQRAGGGDIVNVSSEITGDYLPLMVLYGTSKGGLETFTRMLAHELKPSGIRVSLFVSGSTATGFGVNFTPDELTSALPAWQESGYLTRVAGAPMEAASVADAMVFLLTRPPGQVVDVVHVRSFGDGATP